MIGKMADRGVYIRHLVANMIDASAFFERSINGRSWPKRGYEFHDRVPFPPAQKADRHILNGIVKWARFYLVAKKGFVNGDCLG